jgi:hypothetical protein
VWREPSKSTKFTVTVTSWTDENNRVVALAFLASIDLEVESIRSAWCLQSLFEMLAVAAVAVENGVAAGGRVFAVWSLRTAPRQPLCPELSKCASATQRRWRRCLSIRL